MRVCCGFGPRLRRRALSSGVDTLSMHGLARVFSCSRQLKLRLQSASRPCSYSLILQLCRSAIRRHPHIRGAALTGARREGRLAATIAAYAAMENHSFARGRLRKNIIRPTESPENRSASMTPIIATPAMNPITLQTRNSPRVHQYPLSAAIPHNASTNPLITPNTCCTATGTELRAAMCSETGSEPIVALEYAPHNEVTISHHPTIVTLSGRILHLLVKSLIT